MKDINIVAEARIRVEDVAKNFTLHAQGGQRIPVLAGAGFEVREGECVALLGESGSGKSSMMRMLYGNYRTEGGRIWIRRDLDDGEEPERRWVDVASAPPHDVLELRRRTLGYVSQFLRVIPRVSALHVVAEPMCAAGMDCDLAKERARALLSRLRIREALWGLSPLTFSGGEQQRVNIARGFAHRFPILLLDEPTASLDAVNRDTVLTLIEEARDGGVSVVGIFHDPAARERLGCRGIDVAAFAAAA
ncbi:MAG: phosphonate C-P lyase system protein PhnL [Pseudomonadota bacterium]